MQLFPSSVSFFWRLLHQRRRLTECSDDMNQLAPVVDSAVAADKTVVLILPFVITPRMRTMSIRTTMKTIRRPDEALSP
jgi:hypothetical protein